MSERLDEEREYLQTIFDSTQIGLILVDRKFNVKHANLSISKITAKSLEDLVGQKVGNVIGCVHAEESINGCAHTPHCGNCLIRQTAGRIFQTGEQLRGIEAIHIVCNPTGDKHPIWLELNASPVEIDQEQHVLFSIADITERKTSEQKLKDNQTRLDLALRSAGMGVWNLDLKENKRIFDEQTCLLLGLNHLNFTGKEQEFLDVVHPDDRAVIKSALKKTIEENAPYEVDYRVLRADGSTQYITARGKLVVDDNGSKERINGIIWNITERKLLEQEKEQGLHFMQALLDALPTPIFFKDMSQRYRVCNKAFLEHLNMPRERILGATVFDLYEDDMARKYFEMDAKLLDAPKSQVYETKLKDADGSIKDVIFSKASFPALDGTLMGIAGAITDITQRKRAEIEAQEARQYLMKIINTMADPLFVKDRQHKFILANNAFCALTGCTNAELIGKTDLELFAQSQASVFWQIDEEVFQTGRENVNEELFTDHSGKVHVLLTKKTIYQDICGRSFIVGLISDITERKYTENFIRKAKEEAEAANRAKSEFLANMSHEIRTPMNAVLGFSQVLRRTELTKAQRGYLDMVLASGQLLLRIINDILDYSKIEARKIMLESVDFDLPLLLQEVFRMAAMEMSNIKEVHTYIHIDNDVPQAIKGDPTRLRQILLNLLANSTKFTSQGSIGIHVSLDGQQDSADSKVGLKFRVEDTGIGIPKDKLKSIFGIFTQANTSTTRKYGGTGLGLSICKSLVELMGGTIWAESELGQGSQISFTLKLPKSSSVTSCLPEDESLSGITVAILDDNKISRRLLEEYCREKKMTLVAVEETSDGFLQKAREWRQNGAIPKLFLCDIRLPQVDGYEISRILRSEPVFAAMKIIAVSSDPYVGESTEVKENRIDGYVLKPFVPAELYRVISAVLSNGDLDISYMARSINMRARVLVVEDNEANKEFLRVFLESIGCMAEYVDNGLEAVERLRNNFNDYSLCLMDIRMPVLGGIEATQIIRREISEDFPIIALTAHAMAEDVECCLKSGMTDYLSKPVTIEALAEKLSKYQSRPRRDHRGKGV